ncbi:MAG: glycosyltransferase family 4 protein [Verrucomicrobiia bacterium]
MKILFTNNYDMEWNLKCCQEGKKGKHHLWGAADLPKHGVSYEIISYKRYPFVDRYARPDIYGNARAELKIAARWKYDCVYSAAIPEVMGLGLLRGLGLFPKPIVAVAHHPLPAGRRPRICVRGMDRIICLSQQTAREIGEFFPESRQNISVIPWGWDVEWCKPLKEGGDLMIAAGKTLRDHDTLCQAARETKMPTRIFCSEDSKPHGEVPDWVVVEAGAGVREALLESDLEPWYARAMVVAIPLQGINCLTGLSSVLTAMAYGKPLIVTRNRYLDIDVEKEGCGIWVDPGDVAEWIKAITFIKSNPDAAIEMGRRGRQLCESYYNIQRFSADLAQVIRSVKRG